jgi:hypothetical protein
MAINLTVSLTDAEQAVVEEIAALAAPGASPAQIKAWAEKKAKAGLRAAVFEVKQRLILDQANAARGAQEQALYVAFPDPNAG